MSSTLHGPLQISHFSPSAHCYFPDFPFHATIFTQFLHITILTIILHCNFMFSYCLLDTCYELSKPTLCVWILMVNSYLVVVKLFSTYSILFANMIFVNNSHCLLIHAYHSWLWRSSPTSRYGGRSGTRYLR